MNTLTFAIVLLATPALAQEPASIKTITPPDEATKAFVLKLAYRLNGCSMVNSHGVDLSTIDISTPERRAEIEKIVAPCPIEYYCPAAENCPDAPAKPIKKAPSK